VQYYKCVTVGYVGAVILTLNGAVLAPTLDYTIDGECNRFSWRCIT
jgi:hypothetical protein